MNLMTYHTALLGSPPTDTQRTLYRAAGDGVRGFADSEPGRDKLLAILVLALAQTAPTNGDPSAFHKVLLVIPKAREKWALEGIEAVAKHIFTLHREKPMTVETMKAAFKSLMMGPRTFHLDTPPDRWAAIGFSGTDPMPEWMRERLV